MGDVAEMILEGILCQQCGDYLGDSEDEGYGFPVTCHNCKMENNEEEE